MIAMNFEDGGTRGAVMKGRGPAGGGLSLARLLSDLLRVLFLLDEAALKRRQKRTA